MKINVAQCLARRIRDPAVQGSTTTPAYVGIVLGKQIYLYFSQAIILQNGCPIIGNNDRKKSVKAVNGSCKIVNFPLHLSLPGSGEP